MNIEAKSAWAAASVKIGALNNILMKTAAGAYMLYNRADAGSLADEKTDEKTDRIFSGKILKISANKKPLL